MILGLIFVVAPIGLYGVLAALPPGRAARSGFWTAGALLAVLWSCWLLGAGPFAGDPRADGLLLWALISWTLGVAGAGLLQGLRPRLRATGLGLAYPLAAAGLLAVILGVLLPLLGA